jgi:hypothetical protein
VIDKHIHAVHERPALMIPRWANAPRLSPDPLSATGRRCPGRAARTSGTVARARELAPNRHDPPTPMGRCLDRDDPRVAIGDG